MQSGNGPKINTTFEIPEGDTPGLDMTLKAYEEGWDINILKDPVDAGRSASFNVPGNLKGPGSKP